MYKKVKFAKDKAGVPLEVGYVIRKDICVYTALQKTRLTLRTSKTRIMKIIRAIKQENPATDFKRMRYFNLEIASSHGIKNAFIDEDDFRFCECLGLKTGDLTWRTTLCPHDVLYIFGDRFVTGPHAQRELSSAAEGRLPPQEKAPQSITFNR